MTYLTNLTVFPADLTDMPVTQLAKLPLRQLHEVDANLDQLVEWVKAARTKLDAALDQRFGEAARSALHDSGRDFGTAHISDGNLRIKFDLPKKVEWDQAKLAALVERITEAGDNPAQYVEISYRVSETKYGAWPEVLREQFAAARTLKAGKPGFHLTFNDADGAQ